MATISQTISLEDKVSPNLERIYKNSVLVATQYQRLEKEQNAVYKQMELLEKSGQANSDVYANLGNVFNDYEGAMHNLIENTPDLLSIQEENERRIREEAAANEAAKAALQEKKQAEEEAREEEKRHREEMIALNQQLELLNKGWRKLTGVIREANQWMQASNVQFNAEFEAASKMHTVLGATKEEIQSMYDYAKSLQAVGVVGDEAIISGMSSLAMFTENTEQLNKLIPKVVDLAVQENGLNTSMSNVSSTASMVGRALNGQMIMLKRQLGLTDGQVKAFNKLKTQEEKVNAMVEILNSKVGETNKALASTAQGGIKQATNSLGDLKERLGNQVVPYFELFNKLLVDILTPIVEFVEANSNWLIPSLLALMGVLGGLIIATTIQTIANSALAKSFIKLAPKILAVTWPLLVIVGVLWLFIKLMNGIMGTSFTLLGVVMGIVYLIKAMIQNLFITIEKVLAKIGELFVMFGELVLGIIWAIALGWDKLFGTDYAAGVEAAVNETEKLRKKLHDDADFSKGFVDWREEVNKGVALGQKVSDAINDGVSFDLDSVIGSDGMGGSAIKTTSNDKLLSDDDVQLLLDVATRDYKLNYQQLTPEITVTFTGDIRESVDVDVVKERIVTDLEDIVYSDLGTVSA